MPGFAPVGAAPIARAPVPAVSGAPDPFITAFSTGFGPGLGEPQYHMTVGEMPEIVIVLPRPGRQTA